ncbi:Arc family DNA-binding protein [Stenotrophomonas maltophilia]|uniref:Arc family DNA-binding protein n=1 Tax=Stenotrophomonas maltophilia TaxID=40324 RepID=UPI000F6617EE|nr:Arc family DNA-binding protein [Stenotrophomonas maltophilia]RRU74155.1 Arc family DNA-binding protein [Stenotrophomonas maltophilia]
MADDHVRSQFRIPAEIYEWLKDQARREHRSVNGQLNAELEERMKTAQESAV